MPWPNGTTISIHALLAESDVTQSENKYSCLISIHALLAESDPIKPKGANNGIHFYPRSPCGERLHLIAQAVKKLGISIHALLAESDASTTGQTVSGWDFYPRSPCGERRPLSLLLTLNF